MRLEVSGLDAFYGPIQVLHGVTLTVAEAGITALLGANGAGKTTLLRALCGMVRRHGRVWLEGRPIEALSTPRIARAGIAHVPEGRGTFLDLTVAENLRLGAYAHGGGGAAELAPIFGYFPRLRERLCQPAGTLSGGEQQMLAIARALLCRPRLLLLDEPSFGLAPMLVQEIFAILRRIREERRVSMLLVEQNAGLALALADQACVLAQGRVVMAGQAAGIAGDPGIRDAYLGD